MGSHLTTISLALISNMNDVVLQKWWMILWHFYHNRLMLTLNGQEAKKWSWALSNISFSRLLGLIIQALWIIKILPHLTPEWLEWSIYDSKLWTLNWLEPLIICYKMHNSRKIAMLRIWDFWLFPIITKLIIMIRFTEGQWILIHPKILISLWRIIASTKVLVEINDSNPYCNCMDVVQNSHSTSLFCVPTPNVSIWWGTMT